MHGSASLAVRLLLVVVLTIGFSMPALAGPKESPTPNDHDDPTDLPMDNVLGNTTPVPVPDGDPDDYMDRGGEAGRLAWSYDQMVKATHWIVSLVR